MTDLESLFNELENFEDVRESYIRAPFGYPGGKSRSFDKILPFLPYRKTFVEVFGGSGVIILNRKKSMLDVYNDRYGGVVAFYRCIRDPRKLAFLIQRLELTVHAREEFIWCKQTWEACEDDVERAARWYYMIMTSFGAKSHAFARAINGKAPLKVHEHLPLFYPVHERFKNIQVENQDWKQCVNDYASVDTVFYHDPPYLFTDSGIYDIKMDMTAHRRLLDTIKITPGFHALSGYDNDLYSQYDWDSVHEWSVNVTIDSFAETESNNRTGTVKSGRETAKETLWIKDNT